MNTPLVSVIMTTFNAGDTVEAAVLSILEQTREDFELIIVDDGSEDQTRERLERFDDPRITLHYCAHRGRAAALNTAVSRACGRFIAIADADDISHPDRLAVQAALLEAQPEIDITGSWITLEQPAGTPERVQRFPEHHKDIVALMPIHCSLPFPACMLRSSIMKRTPGFQEEFSAAIDYDWFIRILPWAHFHNIQSTLLIKRTPGSSISVSRNAAQRENALYISRTYLESRMESVLSTTERARVQLQLGMLQYYHGSMRTARGHLWRSLRLRPTLQALRYAAGSMLGDRVMQTLRSSGLAHRLGTPLRALSKKNRYAAP